MEWTNEQNYKFSLSKFKASLLEHFETNPNGKRCKVDLFVPTQLIFE